MSSGADLPTGCDFPALKQTMNNIKELGTPLVKVGIRKFYSLLKKKKKEDEDEEEEFKAAQPPGKETGS